MTHHRTSLGDDDFVALVNSELRNEDRDYTELHDNPLDWLDELRTMKIELDFQLSAARLVAQNLSAQLAGEMITPDVYAKKFTENNKTRLKVLRVRAGVEQRMIFVKALLEDDGAS